MLKHFLALITLSIIVILFIPQLATALHYIGAWHTLLSEKLLIIFSHNVSGKFVSRVLALLLMPIFIALIPAFIYWLAQRRLMPHLMTVTWILWITLATIIAL